MLDLPVVRSMLGVRWHLEHRGLTISLAIMTAPAVVGDEQSLVGLLLLEVREVSEVASKLSESSLLISRTFCTGRG